MGLKCSKCGADNPVTEMCCLECGEKLELQNVTKEQLVAEGKEEKKKKRREKNRSFRSALVVLAVFLGLILLAIAGILIPRRSLKAPEAFPREKRLRVLGYQKVVSAGAKGKENVLWRKIPQLPGVRTQTAEEQITEFSSGEATAWFLAAVHWREIQAKLSAEKENMEKQRGGDSGKAATDKENPPSWSGTFQMPMVLQDCSLIMLSDNRVRVILTWKTRHGISLDLSADYDVRYEKQKLEFQCRRIWVGWLPLLGGKQSRDMEDKVFRPLFEENSYWKEEWKRLRPRLKDIRIHSGRLELVY